MRKVSQYALILLSCTLLLLSCDDYSGKRVHGNGNVRTEDRSVGNFKNVDVSGAATVLVTQGEKCSIRIEADDNLMQYIEVQQTGDKITIRERPGFHILPANRDRIKVYVTAPVYNDIEASGACDIIGQNKISNSENLSVHVSGAGDIRMELEAPRLDAEVSGSGSIFLKGQTKDVSIDLTGAGDAHCYDLQAENTKVAVTGAGSAEVYASVKLDAEVSGVGSVSYKGHASEVNQQVSGAGSVRKAD
ncbi:MAG TPA: head GIN domain-containing protein [Puia sp.]|jgi:hypothetical protein|nr:head GIN domain-containing protein [Puia sp.]